ncbi:MAG: SurA N-terminal domain-containing protein [Candidatus Dojkabacteria bacterium]
MAKAKSKPDKSKKKSGVAPKTKSPKLRIKVPKFKFSKPNLSNYKRFLKPLGIVLGVVLVFILIDLFVQYLNNDFSIAVVNGSRVSKNEYHKKLEDLYGQTVAKQLIDEQIIKQEAQKADIKVTKEEVDQRLEELIQSVGGQESYQAALATNNLTEEDLKKHIETDIITRKLLEPTIEYTDDDVKAFFNQYGSIIFPNETAALEEGEKLDYELLKDQTTDIYIQQQVEQKKYTWLDGMYSEYKIQDNSANKPKYGILTTTINIVKNLSEKLNSNNIEE